MVVDNSKKSLGLLPNMLTGGVAGSIAELVTLPLDTAKMRMQTQGVDVAAGGKPKYNNTFHCIRTLAKEEGPLALWKGLSPGIQRQMVFASLRIGLYDPVKKFYAGSDPEQQKNPSLWKKICAGLTTGAIGITVANPTDLVKIRLQGDRILAPGQSPRYRGSFDAYQKIVATEGVAGLWTGWGPNVVRNSVINAAELAAYDQFKYLIHDKYKLLGDNIWCHFACGALAGFTAVLCGSPMDVMKTRIMNAKKGSAQAYSSVFDCFVKTLRNEGPLAFYSGFTLNCLRIVSWNIVMFVMLERVRNIYRVSVLGEKL